MLVCRFCNVGEFLLFLFFRVLGLICKVDRLGRSLLHIFFLYVGLFSNPALIQRGREGKDKREMEKERE